MRNCVALAVVVSLFVAVAPVMDGSDGDEAANRKLVDNKALIRRYVEVCIGKNDTSLMDELLAADYVLHEPVAGDRGLEAYKKSQPAVLAGFPDGHWTIEDMVAEGDKVAWRFTFKGTQLGEFAGIPATGKEVRVSGLVISRIANGKVAEEWELYDAHGLFRDLSQK
jgi:steroid delta-isomerase-like uncharacterized protein